LGSFAGALASYLERYPEEAALLSVLTLSAAQP
jgi:hypothetical protein